MRGIKKINLVVLVIFAFSTSTYCQISNIDILSPKKLKKYAKISVRANDALTAVYFYEKYHKLRPNDTQVNYELAGLHLKVRNYKEAKELYKKVAEADEEKYPFARFYYAQMLKSTGEYDEAIKEYETFKKNIKWEKESQTWNKIVRNEIAGCDSAKNIIENPQNITIADLNKSINGPHIELSPLPIDDNTFIYASLRVDSLIYFDRSNIDTAMPARQFYVAEKKGMDWIGGEKLPGAINIPGVETGNGILSRDGKRFYFTRCQKNWQGEVICSIYRSVKEGNTWGEPEKLPEIINDPNYTSTQPALGRTAKSDREIIYFVSNKPDGKGGLDIWYSVWNDQKNLYSKVRNLGSKINTVGDEMTPFYNLTNRTLYFSSTGLPGIGGLDIYKAFGERNKWEEIENIGYPVNSSYDDLYFTVSKKGEDGFFVSNRPNQINKTTCCDDIFYYHWNDFIRITVTGVIYPFEQDRFGRKRDLSDFDFMNPDQSIKPLENAKIALYIQDKSSKDYVFLDRYSTAGDGKFYFTLVPDREYEFKMEGFQYFDSKNYLSTEFFNFSDTIEMPPTWVNVLSDKPIVLENIYYEFNSSELSRKAKNVLDTTLLVLLKEAPEFVIEIGSHTDSIGQVKYNLELSQERADNVVKYLVTKGIPSSRLVAKGYGALNPIAPNFSPDGTDNAEGREKNRRTEFKIVGTIDDLKQDEDEEYIGK